MLVQNRKQRSNNHRGRLDIIADILEASQNGTRKTYFMYRCNLSFKQLKYYLGFLQRKGLLYTVNEGRHPQSDLFRITDKGKEFLKAYKGLKALMK
ncbi:MAG: winged helix-turn-helix domain-containing protein [Candidatus Bathyarchaeota archaeon]|nr:winged helix-turn-helix domain-containing protein [Candidatus Bathyarchaeota archaeon]